MKITVKSLVRCLEKKRIAKMLVWSSLYIHKEKKTVKTIIRNSFLYDLPLS